MSNKGRQIGWESQKGIREEEILFILRLIDFGWDQFFIKNNLKAPNPWKIQNYQYTLSAMDRSITK